MVKHFFAMLGMALTIIPGSAWCQEGNAEQESQVLSLPRAIQLALSQNPELKAVAANQQIATAEHLQAGLMPNPELEAEFENFGGSGASSGVDSAETTITLGQLFEMAGKRKKRREVAGFQMSLAQLDYEAKRLDVMADTYLAFIDALAMQQRVSLDQDLYNLAQEVLSSVKARVEAGKVSPLEATKATIALSNARMQWLQNQERLKALHLILAGFWGEDQFHFSRVEGKLGQTVEIPAKEELNAWLLQSPDVARWGTEIAYRKAQLRLEEARRIPDLTFKMGYRRMQETDENTWVAGISLPLPLFNKNQGNIQRAGHLISQGEAQKRAIENQMRIELAAAIQSLKTAFEQTTILQDQILPAAKQAFEGTQLGYSEGKLGYLDVLDAQRTYFEVNIQYIEWLSQYQKHKAMVERLLGRKLNTTQGREEGND